MGWLGWLHAGVVHHHINPSVTRQRGRHERGHVGVAGDIGANGKRRSLSE